MGEFFDISQWYLAEIEQSTSIMASLGTYSGHFPEQDGRILKNHPLRMNF